MDGTSKPDLSHVISQSQRADDLTRQLAGNLLNSLICDCSRIHGFADIDADAHVVKVRDSGGSTMAGTHWRPGRQPLLPPIAGRELMLTFDSQQGTEPVRHNCTRRTASADCRRRSHWQ